MVSNKEFVINGRMGILLLGLIVLSPYHQAKAQNTTEDGDVTILDTIVVQTGSDPAENIAEPTADQSFQELREQPASITVLDTETIDARRVETTRDLEKLFSNVTGFDGGGSRQTNFTIRGSREIGYQTTPGVTPSVGYYLNDVPALNSLGRASVFTGVDSIVLQRGPQTGQYGFSRPGGVFDIYTLPPSSTLEVYGRAGAGNFNSYELSGGISGPTFVDGLSFRVDSIFQKRDGYYDNTALDTTYGDKEAYGVRGSVSYELSPSTTADLSVRHERFNDQSDPFVPLSDLEAGRYEVAYNDPGYEDIGIDVQSLRIKSAFESFEALSVTAHQFSSWEFRSDGDLSDAPTNPLNPFARLIGVTDENIRTYSQEFRIKSNNEDAKLKWSAGAFTSYSRADIEAGFLDASNTQITGFPLREAETKDILASTWFELDYQINSEIRILPGIRYEYAYSEFENNAAAPNVQSASDDFSDFLPSLSLVWEPDNRTFIFAKYARGFKPGGFTADRSFATLDEIEFQSETSDNFELGIRKEIAEKFQFAATVFYSDYDDYQVLNQISPTEFGVNNAQRVTAYGGEIDAQLDIGAGWKTYASLGFTQAKYNRFVNAQGNFSGNSVPYVPEFTANYGVSYTAPFGATIAVNGRTNGGYFLNDGNVTKQSAFTLLDASVSFKREYFELSAFVDNITDETYIANLYDFRNTGSSSTFGNLGDPRTFGVKARLRF